MTAASILKVLVILQVISFVLAAPLFWQMGLWKLAVAQGLLAGVQGLIYL